MPAKRKGFFSKQRKHRVIGNGAQAPLKPNHNPTGVSKETVKPKNRRLSLKVRRPRKKPLKLKF